MCHFNGERWWRDGKIEVVGQWSCGGCSRGGVMVEVAVSDNDGGGSGGIVMVIVEVAVAAAALVSTVVEWRRQLWRGSWMVLVVE